MLKFISLMAWCCLYFQFNLNWSSKSPEWASRAVTLIHGIVATIVGLWLCGTPSLDKCTLEIGPIHRLLMIWSWGYFAFDLMWCLYYWPHNYVILGHHGAALLCFTSYMKKTNSGCIVPCTLAFMEITNPLLQTRWFLRDSGHDKTILFTIVEVAYLVMFIGLRGFLGTYIIARILTANFPRDEKFLAMLLYIVSMALIYEIVGFVLYKYKTKIDEFSGFLVEMGIILDDQT